MGYWKNKQIEDYERGVNSAETNGAVCQNCFSNPGLQKFIGENTIEQHPENPIVCDYCQPQDASLTVACLDAVCEHIVQCLRYRYEDPANTLPFESADGGYQGEVLDTWDLLDKEQLETPHDDLYERIIKAILFDSWCRRNYYSSSSDEVMQFSWEEFQKVVKEGTLIDFMYGRDRGDRQAMVPVEFLDWIGEQLDRFDMVKTIRNGTRLYRARFQKDGDFLRSAQELGPPPRHLARANRFSPEGTVMMYTAEDPGTAVVETAQEPGAYAVGEFELKRDIRVLDLVRLQEPICFFELSNAEKREVVEFLRSFALDASRPVTDLEKPDGDYIPTQVLTQHIRRRFRIRDESLDGIRYLSAKNGTGTNVVLFADSMSVGDKDPVEKAINLVIFDPWIVLMSTEIHQKD